MADADKRAPRATPHTARHLSSTEPGVSSILLAWLLLSVPASLFAGAFIAAGQDGDDHA
jgi:hypothetical protein